MKIICQLRALLRLKPVHRFRRARKGEDQARKYCRCGQSALINKRKSAPQNPEPARAGDGTLRPSQSSAGGPINAAAAQTPEPRAGTILNGEDQPVSAAAPDIMDTEQDEYARKRGYRSIDELLDSKRS